MVEQEAEAVRDLLTVVEEAKVARTSRLLSCLLASRALEPEEQAVRLSAPR